MTDKHTVQLDQEQTSLIRTERPGNDRPVGGSIFARTAETSSVLRRGGTPNSPFMASSWFVFVIHTA